MAANSSGTVYFPVSFPNACTHVGFTEVTVYSVSTICLTGRTTSYFNYSSNALAGSIYYLAVGY